jgi:hypothetical protein
VRPTAAALLALTLAGCGPAAPLELAVREFPTSVRYGQPSSSATPAPTPPAPAPAPGLTVPPPVLLPPPAPSLITVLLTPAPTCRTAGPLDAAAQPATDTATLSPAQTSYQWRVSGSYTNGGTTVQFPTAATVNVSNDTPVSSNGEYSFDVTDTAGGLGGTQSVTTTYQVVPEPQGGEVGGVSTTQASGIYITRVATSEPSTGAQVVFTPSPPILYLPFPATSTQPSWTVDSANSGTSGGSAGTVEQLTATIVGRGRVDACGTILDSWKVHATGTITSASQSLNVDETYYVGTEYGGIPLEQSVTYTGTNGGATITSTSTQTMSVIPLNPS